MTHEEKTTFIHNIFKLLIGTIFLITCLSYLKSHPAEKIALYSGFKNIIQKIEILGYNLVGKNGKLLEEKYKLESDYIDTIHFAEEKGCSDPLLLEELHNTYNTLLKEDQDQAENYVTKYRILQNDYVNKILSSDC